ncbi:methylmalonyl Co-A mutase-associated GTPase MeaB [Planotetraspora kaengkrachanensis]|uniref:ATPase/protein kinase n=1 Tax=Planotetraspora kaengkrachanensis TaxID=575193 RepID=A0A8J3PZK5_9ACTN|nr:methylmalonyl Co-A mutase-associated GTPase MeaB [Planotetraspora kaengkrachanensis]GIG84009.1 ATPase/protein kinase [Planotetraspora kaengkrachanensis]
MTPDGEDYLRGVLKGDRRWIARAITLVESTRADHRDLAQRLLVELTPHAGRARRVGVSGVPGVGKSTFIEALGTSLTAQGHRVAVLAVDPSSRRSGGSILGDKTRMARLAADQNAFIRPSPTAGTLGGVATATREAMVVVEAAGYDIVLVETVGVGQSETAVADMVDTFLLLTLARTGDQLQGIKKGVLELADVIAVNKADGEYEQAARKAAAELAGALRLLRSATPVLTCSGMTGAGLDELWRQIIRHQEGVDLAARRSRQQVEWTWALVRDRLLARLGDKAAPIAPSIERQVLDGTLTPSLAADRILRAFLPEGDMPPDEAPDERAD